VDGSGSRVAAGLWYLGPTNMQPVGVQSRRQRQILNVSRNEVIDSRGAVSARQGPLPGFGVALLWVRSRLEIGRDLKSGFRRASAGLVRAKILCPFGASVFASGGLSSMVKYIGFLALYTQSEAIERQVENGGGIQR
jgi:hypothetical protein